MLAYLRSFVQKSRVQVVKRMQIVDYKRCSPLKKHTINETYDNLFFQTDKNIFVLRFVKFRQFGQKLSVQIFV